MRDSAPPGSRHYKLYSLAATPLLFRVRAGARLPRSGRAASLARFFSEHPGAGLNEARAALPELAAPGQEGYELARTQVARLVEAGVLEVCGELPLEEVDERYERVRSCDLCGQPSDGHPTLLWKHNTPVARCTACGLVYANPRWKAEHLFGRYTTDYWQTYEQKLLTRAADTEANSERTAFYLWTLEPAYSTGRLLDVGCATGDFLLAARRKGWEIYGVETSDSGARVAREVTGAQIHTGTLDTAPLEPGSFDAITMFDVIEHLQSPRAYMELIARLLRPGGMVAIATPNIRSLAFRLLGARWEAIGPNDHLYYFAPRTLHRLFETCGFDLHMMRSETTEARTWQAIFRGRLASPLASRIARRAEPAVTRLMLGDSIYAIGRSRGAGVGNG